MATRLLRIALSFALLLPLAACQGQCGSKKSSSDPKSTVAAATAEEGAPAIYRAPHSNPSLCLQGENLPSFFEKLNAGLPTGIPELDQPIEAVRPWGFTFFGCTPNSIPTTIEFDKSVPWVAAWALDPGSPARARIIFSNEKVVSRNLVSMALKVIEGATGADRYLHEIGHAAF